MKRLASAKIADIQKKIRALEAMKRVLTGLTKICPCSGASTECPVLHSIDFAEVRT